MNQQVADALALANHRRLADAALKRQIAALPRIEGEEMVARTLEKGADAFPSMQLRGLLAAPFRRGGTYAERLLRECDLVPRKRLDELTQRQRNLLAAAVRAGYSTDDFDFTAGFVKEPTAA